MKRNGRTLIFLALVGALVVLPGCIFAPDAGSGRPEFSRQPTLGQELLDLERAREVGALTGEEYDRLKARLIERAR